MPPIRVTRAAGSYEVHVSPGISAELGMRIASVLPDRRLALVTDEMPIITTRVRTVSILPTTYGAVM